MKSYLLALPVTAALLVPMASMADTSYITYDHSYRTENRYHLDHLALAYRFDNGLRFEIGTNLLTNKKKDHAPDPTNYAEYFDASYEYQINDSWSVMPSMQFKFYPGAGDDYGFSGEVDDDGSYGARYTPGLQVKYKIIDSLSVFSAYKFETRHYSHGKDSTSEPPVHKRVYQLGADYQINKQFSLHYVAQYDDATYTLADNHRSDYKQSAFLYYRVNRDWQPFVGLNDEPAATDNDHHEAVVTAGFNFYF